jgi:hypothetical protein
MALTVTGTLGGVIITQAANSVSTQGVRRKERNDRINDAVGDLIASGTAWVYAVNAYEESMFNTVILNLGEDETRDAISSGRAAVHSAQLAYGRAQARVRLTCPPSIVDAAERYRVAVQAFDDEMVANVGVVLKKAKVQREVL